MSKVRIGRFVFAVTTSGVVVAAALWVWFQVREMRAEIRCKETLSRQLYERALRPNQRFASQSEFAVSAEFHGLICAASGHSYVYRTVDEETIQDEQRVGARPLFHLIAWCPSASHKGCRVALLENGAVHLLSEAAFQRAIAAGYRCENRSETGE